MTPLILNFKDGLKAQYAIFFPVWYMAGRQHLATPSASVEMADGSIIVGTKDMMLAKIKDSKIKSLGAVTPCGSVNIKLQ